ncbi:hypothetical protein KFL_001160085 [Klebsormidium nitens]|uniref:Uncharacterized protein n=1 Tax=Klebsormidium nitens TaxID=105231 RepID=A0A1Y1I1D0_KLENI|nr:hypothetical protein KFL_001160085 [Klebsormidium nitens]|eukprot:GAQ82576.1 hypothetical protein KFL_001160085 [Klebsormidium nitens]
MGLVSLVPQYYLVIEHTSVGLLFFAMGVWHTLNCLAAFARTKSAGTVYVARVYHRAGKGWLKHIELYALMGIAGVPIIVAWTFVELISPDGRATGEPSITGLQNYQHFVIYAGFVLCAALARAAEARSAWLDLPAGALHGAWGVQWMIIFVLIRSHMFEGVEWLQMTVHNMYSLPVGACMALALLQAAGHWHNVMVDLGAAAALTLQGTWLVQAAFLLFIPGTMPTGCKPTLMDPENDPNFRPVVCASGYATDRAAGLVTWLFASHLAAVAILTVLLHVLVTRVNARRSKGPYVAIDCEVGKPI